MNVIANVTFKYNIDPTGKEIKSNPKIIDNKAVKGIPSN